MKVFIRVEPPSSTIGSRYSLEKYGTNKEDEFRTGRLARCGRRGTGAPVGVQKNGSICGSTRTRVVGVYGVVMPCPKYMATVARSTAPTVGPDPIFGLTQYGSAVP